MAKIKVQLKKNMIRNKIGLVDPENGAMICVQLADDKGILVVEKTKFIQARIKSGDLLEVTADNNVNVDTPPEPVSKPDSKAKVK